MREVGILEAKTGLSGLVADVQRTGEEIILTKHGRPAAKIVPVQFDGHAGKRDPEEWRQRVRQVLARRDARPPEPDFDDLSWEQLKRVGRGENRYD